MPKQKNTAIGDVACPMAKCSERASVYRYRERASQEVRKRFAGKLYAICPRGHRCEDQEHLLENAKIWGAKEGAAPVATAPAVVQEPFKTVVKESSAPVPAKPAAPVPTASAPEEKASSGWGFFR